MSYLENSSEHLAGVSDESFKDTSLATEEVSPAFRRRVRRLRFKRINLVRSKSKVWMLMICLSLGVVPRTLMPCNRDPKASEDGYTEDMKREWRHTQLLTGLEFVRVAKRREELYLKRKEIEWWEEVKELSKEVGEEVWDKEFRALRREEAKFKINFNKGHRESIRALLLRERREVPFWLTREAREQWENTIIIEGEGVRRTRGMRKINEETMWASWRDDREDRVEAIDRGEYPNPEMVEREVRERLRLIASTPGNPRVQQREWHPSPVGSVEGSRRNLEET